ncbi:MAG: 1-deoxy-D-xylulose-5-phosphate reductoisomerase [Blastocatellia bacterium]|nr:1-deoxy-D-xylulose-5-phosphate reductoisomerase [Blastocatellia bacterium]
MKVSLLGATGSIGCNTLDVIRWLAPRFEVDAMSAGTNVERFAEQIREFHPSYVAVADEPAAEKLKTLLGHDYTGEIGIGTEGMVRVATAPETGIVVSATVGARGLVPTLRAIECGKRVGIANKEPLVMAGELMTRRAREAKAEILPIDSEHNALHQCLRGERTSDIKRLILTASGGPFRRTPLADFQQITVAQALKHPTWQMGRKITIDSATLMNKGLEVVEARWLFNLPPDQIDVIIHPQSTVHSMVELVDGSTMAQLGIADMRHPIQYALTYPDRLPAHIPALDLLSIGKLEFEAPDLNKFPCLRLAYDSLRAGGTMPAVLNAANEEAVAAFLDERIRFVEIPLLIEHVMHNHSVTETDSLETILAADTWARQASQEWIFRNNKQLSATGSESRL